MEKHDIMSMNEQLATRKLIEDIEQVLTNTTSFSIANNVRRLMTDYRKEWPRE